MILEELTEYKDKGTINSIKGEIKEYGTARVIRVKEVKALI